jgi:hypothetical protein
MARTEGNSRRARNAARYLEAARRKNEAMKPKMRAAHPGGWADIQGKLSTYLPFFLKTPPPRLQAKTGGSASEAVA